MVSNSFGNFETDLAFAQVAKNAAGFYEQLGVFAGALVVAVPVISSLAWNGYIIIYIYIFILYILYCIYLFLSIQFL